MLTPSFAALILLAGCSHAAPPTHEELRATTLKLEFVGGWCSGTAIAKDKLLTSSHCFDAGGLEKVNGVPVEVVSTTSDEHDVATATITGLEFKSWAKVGPPLKQGDSVRWWGVPLGEGDVFRRGYVSKVGLEGTVIDATVCRGDSGSALFADDGTVRGVIAGMSNSYGCTFLIALPSKLGAL